MFGRLVTGKRILARGQRRTENQYAIVNEQATKYGKYAKYFDDPEDLLIKYQDKWDHHHKIIPFTMGKWSKFLPFVRDASFIAPSATIAGNVEVWYKSSIWYGCVVKGDVNLVRIGSYTNIQDNTVIHEAFKSLAPDHDGSTIIGHYVSVENSCMLRGCTIEDYCIIGSNSVLQEGSYMERYCQLEPLSVLQVNTKVPSGQLWGGNPAHYIRTLTDQEKIRIEELAIAAVNFATVHEDQFYLPNSQYQKAEEKNFSIGYTRPFLSLKKAYSK